MRRAAVECSLLFLLSGLFLIGAIALTSQVFSDERSRYFVIGYYCAIHHVVVKWVWTKLFKKTPSPP